VPAVSLQLPGMTCRHQVRLVTARLRDLPGVETVAADWATAVLVVEGTATEAQLLAALSGLDVCRDDSGH
jgi:copper chaperone CopZ